MWPVRRSALHAIRFKYMTSGASLIELFVLLVTRKTRRNVGEWLVCACFQERVKIALKGEMNMAALRPVQRRRLGPGLLAAFVSVAAWGCQGPDYSDDSGELGSLGTRTEALDGDAVTASISVGDAITNASLDVGSTTGFNASGHVGETVSVTTSERGDGPT